MTVDLPPEFEKIMKDRLKEQFDAFIHALQEPAPVSYRLNPKKPASLEGATVPWCAQGRYIDQRPAFTLDPLLHAGAYYVQEASSMLIGEALRQTADLKKKLIVLDLCAAPGGKSTHLASLLSPDSMLVSNEVIRSRCSILSENLQKWGLSNVIITQNDPSDFAALPGLFDVILVDAPCSGEGLFRKDQAARNEWSVAHTEHCALRQKRILQEIWPALKPGGVLLYSTCTYNEGENLGPVSDLVESAGAESLPLTMDPSWQIDKVENKKVTGHQCFPHRVKGEGFFLTAVRKTGSSTHIHTARQRWQEASQAIKKEIQPWVRDPESMIFFMHDQNVRMLPAGHENLFQSLLNHLHVVSAGTSLAEVTRNKLVPDHALALSVELLKSSFPQVPVDSSTAVAYLRKDNLFFDGPPGFALITYQGLGLGWINRMAQRTNNMYPAQWRVRMDPLRNDPIS